MRALQQHHCSSSRQHVVGHDTIVITSIRRQQQQQAQRQRRRVQPQPLASSPAVSSSSCSWCCCALPSSSSSNSTGSSSGNGTGSSGSSGASSSGRGLSKPSATARGATSSSTTSSRRGQRRATSTTGSSSELSVLSEPLSTLDVDAELWELLDLCSDEELEGLYHTLHSASPFSPLVKSLVREEEPPLLALRGRTSIMHKIEARFRFLAADSNATISGRRPSYRQTLLQIRDRLDVECSSNLSTPDLEAEIFLHVLQHCVECVQAEGDRNPRDAASVAYADGDGMTSVPEASQLPRANWTERLTAPFRFGGQELLPPALKLGSAVTLTAMMRQAAGQLGRQLLSHHVRYQAVAQAATSAGARGMLSQWQRQAALAAAQKGLTSATLRYSAVRSALGVLGPVMWAWLAVDLVRAAVGTDYARVVRAVYVLAQVRLVATQGWTNTPLGTVEEDSDSPDNIYHS